MRRTAFVLALLLPAMLAVSGCDMLGIESADRIAASREADGKAIGSACRHAGRAIEDCFALNKRADKAAVFAGWREMNDYMRDNKVETVSPQGGPAPAESAAKAEPPAEPAAKPAGKGKKADKVES